MTQIHEEGEVWHIGWEQHAGLWYVEAPDGVELDEPVQWFTKREDAFAFVDEQIIRQPVQESVLDRIWGKPIELPPVGEAVLRYQERSRTVEPTPRSETHSDRLDIYKQMVGLR